MLILCYASSVVSAPPSSYITEKNLNRIYQIGSDFIDHYTKTVFESTSPDWFSKFESEVEMNMYQVGIPIEFQGDVGYYDLLSDVNNFTTLAEKQDFRIDGKTRDDFIRAAVGLVITVERASFHHINRVENLNKILQGLYLRNHFTLMAPEGMSKDPSRFMWCYLVGRYFHFPLDIVSSGINELGLLKISWKDSPSKQLCISNFLAGYAAHGLEINNQNFMVWKGFRNVKMMMPLQLINTVLESLGNSEQTKELKLWALQQKYRFLKKHGLSKTLEEVYDDLLTIYKTKNLSAFERFKIFLSESLSGNLIYLIMGACLLLILYSPIKLLFGNSKSRLKDFLRALWNILSGKFNHPWQQIGLIVLIFCSSLLLEDLRRYSPPLEVFSLSETQ